MNMTVAGVLILVTTMKDWLGLAVSEEEAVIRYGMVWQLGLLVVKRDGDAGLQLLLGE